MPTNLGERFANAVAAKDAVALRALLAPDVVPVHCHVTPN